VLLNGRLEKNKHYEMMIQPRLNERVANLVVEVVDKDGYQQMQNSTRSVGTSGVTSAAAGRFSSIC
jgi:hypothetical protein